MGNVDKTVLRRIALPGAIGAFVGATVLSGLSTQAARPWASGLLLILGFYVLFRYLRHRQVALKKGRPGTRFLIPLGLVGGFVDATGGGGWGPVTTPALLANGRMAPNRVIGTMNAAEFLVAVAASVGFIIGLGIAALDWQILLPAHARRHHRGADRGLDRPPPADARHGRGRRRHDHLHQLADADEGVRRPERGHDARARRHRGDLASGCGLRDLRALRTHLRPHAAEWSSWRSSATLVAHEPATSSRPPTT